jgi:hypothetical protein
MRARALFAIMFGLGAGAVAVGVTVSLLVVGPAPERGIETSPPAAVETTPATAPATPLALTSVAEPPTEPVTPRSRRALARKHFRPEVVEPDATASAPRREADTPIAEPWPVAIDGGSVAIDGAPVAIDGAPVAIVRGGAAPATRAHSPGPRIIQLDPETAGR